MCAAGLQLASGMIRTARAAAALLVLRGIGLAALSLAAALVRGWASGISRSRNVWLMILQVR